MLTDMFKLILYGWSNLFEYIIGTNNIGVTSKEKSQRRMRNKMPLSFLLIPKKKGNFQY